MSSLQREIRLLVIEERRAPFVSVMATCAITIASAKLAVMGILMTLIAAQRSTGEINMKHCLLHIRRMMTVRTCHSTVRADKRKVRRAVIKAREILPVFRGMTGHAAHRLARCIQCGHARCKLAVMNVFMACRAA